VSRPNAVEAESRALNNFKDQSSSKSWNYITLTTKPAMSGSVRRTNNRRKRNTPRLVSTCDHWGIEINIGMTLHKEVPVIEALDIFKQGGNVTLDVAFRGFY